MSCLSVSSRALPRIAAAAALLIPAATARAGDLHYSLSLNELEITEGYLPPLRYAAWPVRYLSDPEALMLPAVLLDGPGEAFLVDLRGAGVWKIQFAARVPHAEDVTGRLVVPSTGSEKRIDVRFRVPASRGSADPLAFGKVMELRCHCLAKLAIPGAGWFRCSSRGGLVERTPHPSSDGTGLDATLALFTGARTLAEHLQLDHFLRVTDQDEETVALDTIGGIALPRHVWKDEESGPPPAADPLARLIPADQHAIFFPSCQALLSLIDEAHSTGTPILRLLEEAAIETDARGRYERQLCLEPDELAREIGPLLVDSVAVTGSDPYYRTGSDVAVLFESEKAAELAAWLEARQRTAASSAPGAETLAGETKGVPWVSVRTPDRTLCSYLARQGSVVLVTNSLAQVEAFAGVLAGSRPALESLPEYRYFRTRYARGSPEETALFVLSDATIRRWLEPRWRVGASRRIRAAAGLAHERARQVERLGLAAADAPPEDSALAAQYGNLAFITPVAELSVERATLEEVAAYERFRVAYEGRRWTSFDPIAVRLSLAEDGLDSDVTVIPLSRTSDLQQLRQLCGSASIAAGAGDPHPGTILHVAHALNLFWRGSSLRFSSLLTGSLAEMALRRGPLRYPVSMLWDILPSSKSQAIVWVGNCLSLYLDADPLWEELSRAADLEDFIEEHFSRLPLALTLEVKDAEQAARALAAAQASWTKGGSRSFRTDTVTWRGIEAVRRTETQEAHRRRAAPDDWSPLTLFCAVLPGRLVITPCEAVLHSAIDRALSPGAVDAPSWQGQSVALRLEREVLDAVQAFLGEWEEEERQKASWRNLPILNEWRRLFPDQDPVLVHRRLFDEELVCPGGGAYVWSEEWRTMESTAYGCPLAPRQEPRLPSVLDAVETVEAGITFEGDGLRAKLRIRRR
ncbi:MAG: hypothetical protein HY812_15080 [Planctomycetes bacterium]|nr:hypothetical protein [Planctomycetota bacterium]